MARMTHCPPLPYPLDAFSPWPVLTHGRSVRIAMSSRDGGVSQAPFDSLNVGDHVRDRAEDVARNRRIWAQRVGMRPVWMQQVHGIDVVHLSESDGVSTEPLVADAAWTDGLNVACTIMVADCLPVLFAHAKYPLVAAAHAGWRGLAGLKGVGVLEATVARLAQAVGEPVEACAAQLRVWLGPCIGPSAFEVGVEVREAFVTHAAADIANFSAAASPDHYFADLAALARARLARAGVREFSGNDSSPAWCTHTQAAHYFSHRRDASVLGSTGRMVAAISLL